MTGLENLFARLRTNTTSPKPEPAPKHIEIWGHLLATHRFYKRLAAGSILLAFLGLAGGAYGMLVAMHRPLVFHVDSEGRATAMGRVADNLAPADVEVRGQRRHLHVGIERRTAGSVEALVRGAVKQ